MKKCWICNQCYDDLSEEHIIPRYFGGSVSTEDFSCEKCNQNMGKVEQKLNQISVLMHNLDSADGEPKTVTPLRGSRNRETKWSYGDDPSIQLSTTGHVQSDGWERPPGKYASGDKIWIPGQISMNLSKQDVHTSMLKAIMALVCHVDMPKHLFETPLAYLSGDHNVLKDMQPTDLCLAPREIFARVWVLAPPTRQTMTIYGAVVYGPISNIYRLCTDLEPIGPFCCELRAYSRQCQSHCEQTNYMKWLSTTLEELAPRSQFDYVRRNGPFTEKRSRNSGLVALEASPSRVSLGVPQVYAPMDPLELTHGLASRFGNWLRSTLSEESHARFLADVRKLDTTHQQG